MRRTALLVGITLLASQAARANTLQSGDIGYTTLAAWQAAVTETGVDTFEGVAPSGGDKTYNNSAGYTDPLGMDFVGAFNSGAYLLEIVDSLFPPTPWWNFGSGASLASGPSSTNAQPSIVVTLPASVTAISLDVMTYGNNVPVTLTASDGSTETVSTASRAQTFYGFTFSAPVSTFTVSIPGAPNSTYVLLDNFAIGAADMDTPESATMLLIGIGLVFMAVLGKRRPA
jgi:hypothetical protein